MYNSGVYSDGAQDLFIVNVLKEKMNGTFLDFGCRCPIKGNNTYLLEKKYNFSGLSFDIDTNEISIWKNSDRNYENAICCDLLNYDFEKKMDEFYSSNIIDYFSFDLEPPLLTLEVLKKIPFDKYKFGIITYEHDFYRGYNTVKPSREIFLNYGYKKINKEFMDKIINPDKNKSINKVWLSEDWWIHPDVISVDHEILDKEIIDLID